MRNLLQNSIKTKILLLILLVTGCITIILISLSANLSNDYLTKIINEHGLKTVDSYADTVSQWFEERENDIKVYSENPFIKELEWGEYDNYFKEELKNNDIYNLFFIADGNGNFYSTADKNGSILDRSYFHSVMTGKNVISKPIVSKVSGEDIIVIAAPITKNRKVVGLMGATIELEVLADFINAFKLDYQDAISYIVNTEGDLITYPNKEFIMAENIFEVSPNIEKNLAESADIINYKNKGSFSYQKEADNILVYYQKIKGVSDWYFLAQVSEVFIDKHIYGAVKRLVIIGLVGIILSLFLSHLISRGISRPIIGLKEVFNKAADGSMDVRADCERQDEIGQAARAFNKMMDTLNRVTFYDIRTGLPNRQFLDNTLGVLCTHASTNEEIFAVINIRIDQYNKIVDSMGHNSGDVLLSTVANNLKNISDNMKVFSWIEGQFILVLTELQHYQDIYQYIRKISVKINKKWEIEGSNFHITSSMGIAVYPENGNDKEALLKNSSLAMHRAVDSTENSYQFYNSKMNKELIRDITLDNAMRIALEDDQFVLHYQPQYDINKEEIIGFEALIRWIHPSKGLISPAYFVPVAEENGMINEIGLWVLKEACSAAFKWNEHGKRDIKIAVNIATSQLMQDEFVDIIEDILKETGLKAELLELEITERAMLSSVDKTINTLNKLKELGVKIAVDDFGTGYSSLRYLKDFSLDHLKIDMSFIQQLDKKMSNKEIVRAIIAMGHSLNLQLTAEGIENQRQLKFLRKNNCDFVQGYYYSRPLPEKEIYKLL